MSSSYQENSKSMRGSGGEYTPGWKSPWVWGMVGLIVVMICVNMFMIYIGSKTAHGLVVDDFYERGKNYFEAEVNRQETENRLGWKIDLLVPVEPRMNVSQNYRLKVVDADGYPVPDASVEFLAFRPDNSKRDFSMAMFAESKTMYSAKATFPFPGHWDLLIVVKQGEDEMDIAKRIFIKK
ncbi:MAG TPA: nitrogen fixation protein FixH [Crenotrichaceae bacterium]|nr:nitrogen fixation protein FixH [Crenotrichaceae bacterium]